MAVEYLQPYINNPAVLTQSNVAAFQYSNGHHRASPALNNAQQQQQQRSESPSASGAPPLPPKPTMDRAPKVPASSSHAMTNGVDHPTLTRKYSPNQQNGNDLPPPLHPRRDAANPNPPPTPPPPRGTTPPPPQSSMVAQYSNSPINTTLPTLQRRMSPVPQVGAYSKPQGPGMMVSSAVQRGTSPVTNVTPVRPHNTREHQTKVHQQLQAICSPNIFGPDNGTAEPPPPSYSQTLAAVNGNTNPPPPPPSYSQTMHMRQSPTLSSTSSVSDYRYV